jgi:hypothetical protein
MIDDTAKSDIARQQGCDPRCDDERRLNENLVKTLSQAKPKGRLAALRTSGQSRQIEVGLWRKCEVLKCPLFRCSWGMSGHISADVQRPPLDPKRPWTRYLTATMIGALPQD